MILNFNSSIHRHIEGQKMKMNVHILLLRALLPEKGNEIELQIFLSINLQNLINKIFSKQKLSQLFSVNTLRIQYIMRNCCIKYLI
jgi:hypothetical protein